MLRIKRLYTFMLQTFVPLFAMTFCIVLFIVLMQFLWRFIDDLVGKGLEVSVIAELFFYAALTMVPMALPLAILLASLMTFGNLGEKFELTAMKASGISLMRVMKPLTILMIFIAAGAFVFQNNVLPVAQTKMWTLLFSMRQTRPENEIDERVFNDRIPGFNIYVEQKDRKTAMLYDLMIYDMSAGSENARIIVADSGRVGMAPDGAHMAINLYQGEQFENLRQRESGISSRNLPFRRESFTHKDVLIPFDAEFNRLDESSMRRQYVGKNMAELNATIDSVQERVDSIGDIYVNEMQRHPYFSISYDSPLRHDLQPMSAETAQAVAQLDLDSLVANNPAVDRRRVLSQALNKASRIKQDYEYRSLTMEEDRKNMRRHAIELHKKFTLSFACIIMFFIGAPLGAIIRKGGIGLPLVVSVILFIIYYIIDNTGYKLARDGRMAVAAGMWLSSAVLLPLGVFLTYKAMHDSNLFNFGAVADFFRRLRRNEAREVFYKDFTLEEVDRDEAIKRLTDLGTALDGASQSCKSLPRWLRPLAAVRCRHELRHAGSLLDATVAYLAESRSRRLVQTLSEYPLRLTPKNITHARQVNSRLLNGFINNEWLPDAVIFSHHS